MTTPAQKAAEEIEAMLGIADHRPSFEPIISRAIEAATAELKAENARLREAVRKYKGHRTGPDGDLLCVFCGRIAQIYDMESLHHLFGYERPCVWLDEEARAALEKK